MLSTIKSVEEYTGINLYQTYNSIVRRQEIVNKRLELDPQSSFTVDDVDADFEARQHIKRAQAIIEIFVGKDEIEIDNPADLILLDKMVSYQSAYMIENEEVIFKQAALTSQGQTDSLVNFDTRMLSPFIAPLAVMAATGLSFNRSRSYKTGKIFQFSKITKWRNV